MPGYQGSSIWKIHASASHRLHVSSSLYEGQKFTSAAVHMVLLSVLGQFLLKVKLPAKDLNVKDFKKCVTVGSISGLVIEKPD